LWVLCFCGWWGVMSLGGLLWCWWVFLLFRGLRGGVAGWGVAFSWLVGGGWGVLVLGVVGVSLRALLVLGLVCVPLLCLVCCPVGVGWFVFGVLGWGGGMGMAAVGGSEVSVYVRWRVGGASGGPKVLTSKVRCVLPCLALGDFAGRWSGV